MAEAEENAVAPSASDGPAVLRIIHVNDVYTLDRFASFHTLCKKYRTQNTVITHGGDFCSPYLLASLDHGKGMIKMMNLTKFDIACFGNHEADLKLPQLHRRIKESEFAWVNSNMPGFVPPEGKLPRYLVKEVGGKKIAFIGLCTEQENQYKKGRFGNCEILNVNETAPKLYDELMNEKGMDFVVCLTHQNMPWDRELAQKEIFPIILGGHDHDLYDETYGKSRLLKVGEDMKKVGIVDITFGDGEPKVDVQILNTDDFEADESIAKEAEAAKYLVTAVQGTMLMEIPSGVVLSSKDARAKPNALASLIATSRKDVLGVDCGFFHGGGVRGSSEFRDKLTLANLMETMPFGADIGRVQIPGQVIEDMIKFSRVPGFDGRNAAFLHTDKFMQFDDDGNIERINMEPFDPERKYMVGMDRYLLGGGNGIKPLNDYMETENPHIGDGAIDMSITVTYLCDLFWLNLADDIFDHFNSQSNMGMDQVKSYLKEKFGDESGLPDIMSQLFFNAADLNQDGEIAFEEVQKLRAFHDRNFEDLFGTVDHAHNIISNLTRRETVYTPGFKVDKRFLMGGLSGRYSFALLPETDDVSEEEDARG